MKSTCRNNTELEIQKYLLVGIYVDDACELNSSIMSSTLISISLCTWSRAREDKRSFPIVGLRGVLTRLKLLSAEQKVTGKVQRINNRTLIFGKRNEAWGSVEDSVVGREALPCSCSCCFHLIYQL